MIWISRRGGRHDNIHHHTTSIYPASEIFPHGLYHGGQPVNIARYITEVRGMMQITDPNNFMPILDF